MTLIAFNMLVYSYTAESEALDQLVQELCVELKLSRPKKHKLALKAVLVNLIFNRTPIGLYRAKQVQPSRKNPDYIGQKALRAVLDALARENYIKQTIGSRVDKKCTIISGTKFLTTRFKENNLKDIQAGGSLVLDTRFDPVVLKNKAGDEISYKDTAYTNEVRDFLQEYEQFLQEYQIDYNLYGIPGTEKNGIENDTNIPQIALIRRTYNWGSFQMGGRISGPWSNITKQQRNTLCFYKDGVTSRTVEIDMPCSSVNLLYRLQTGYAYDGDAYQVRVNGIQIPRMFSKRYMNIALNSSPRGLAGAFRDSLPKGTKDAIRMPCTVSELKEALLQMHSPIRNYLFKPEIGMLIQWSESELVYLALKKLLALKIPALSVYDSFIVREQDAELVKEVLNTTAKDTELYLSNFKS